MDGPKQIIEKLRRDKFYVGAKGSNPLASDLHQAIRQLSVELYQNDLHFIKEIIQNAEDNVYDEDVCPSLEFQLINGDVAKVGSSATLLVLNNEKGLTEADVKALCSVGRSTKVGRRNEGFIGSKGIGFKSVFMICKTPMIFSNGYRIGFRDEVSTDAGVGYILPEWLEAPSDDDILAASGRDELPTTIIVLPIRNGKVDLVRKQLKELTPEMILFLQQIRELNVVEKNGKAAVSLLRIARTEPVSGITSDLCKFFEVQLQVENVLSEVSDTHSYLIFQRSYPVTHPVEEREEMSEWIVTLGFPKEGRAQSGHSGDVCSFLPTELRTGFPFIINADFILTSSRETIRFDSDWNIGILDCIPDAYRIAFLIMLRRSKLLVSDGVTLNSEPLLAFKDAYRYLPVNSVEDAHRYSTASSTEHRKVRQKIQIQPHLAANLAKLEHVRALIFEMFEKERVIRLSRSDIGVSEKGLWATPQFCLQIKPSFRRILEGAAEHGTSAPSVLVKSAKFDGVQKFDVVDGYIQEKYGSGLCALGVRDMNPSQYKNFIVDSNWLLDLPEYIYFQVLSFFAFEINVMTAVLESNLLKVRGDEGEVELAKFCEFSRNRMKGVELFYTVNPDEDPEWISEWVKIFNHWLPARVMPAETSQALLDASDSSRLIGWIKKHGSLSELTAQKYFQKLVKKLVLCNKQKHGSGAARSKRRRAFPVLVAQFLYDAIGKELLRRKDVVRSLQSLKQVAVVDHNSSQERGASSKMREEGRILLPPKVSKWPHLFALSPVYASHLIVLSDMYLNPQCSLVEKVVTSSPGPDSMMEFLKQAFNAVDLPNVELPAIEPFPLVHPMTLEKSRLILQWLKGFLPNRRTTKSEQRKDCLLQSLKTMDWMKTYSHGWQRPTAVFLHISSDGDNSTSSDGDSSTSSDGVKSKSSDGHPKSYGKYFNIEDLPFLDQSAYHLQNLNDSDLQFVFAELGVVTKMDKGSCAVVIEHFSRRPAEKLDLETVKQFYAYLSDSGWSADETQSVKLWIPVTGTSKVPMWRAASECLLRDKDDIFTDIGDITVLEKHYEEKVLVSLSAMLRIPETGPLDLYLKVWLKWCSDGNGVPQSDISQGQKAVCLNRAKVHHVWKQITQNWQHKGCSKYLWLSFLSQAWVPVHPSLKDSESSDSETIYVMPPNQVFIADDNALAKSFLAKGANLNFAWVLPDLSPEQLNSSVELNSKMGVKALSEVVTCDIHIPADVEMQQIPHGKGLICEGLFRSVLAFLCQKGEMHGLSASDRQKLLSPLMSAVEFVVSEPFPKRHSLKVSTSPPSEGVVVSKNVLSHYCKETGILYYVRKDHPYLKGDVGKRCFQAHLAAILSNGFLSVYPELARGLTALLKLLCDSGFSMKSVEYELELQNLRILPEDEKLLAENMANRRRRRQTDLMANRRR